ncbi:uncharacterized protein C8Q71DRAFT_726628 [Rhodofomes roseus]|uniref:Uncharacterized protein n=1 Tax=Rhodofomes roseus TaxID=34475 RepID=A0ABQ8K4E8_9APHY|nr:uncharacterized protein C8Q71DRAFT_726628 [Rhodofomes roseus]KAH9831736.1 hypothetical protein C8Q71DRAFT_726628 [Rhodofomes roseus]
MPGRHPSESHYKKISGNTIESKQFVSSSGRGGKHAKSKYRQSQTYVWGIIDGEGTLRGGGGYSNIVPYRNMSARWHLGTCSAGGVGSGSRQSRLQPYYLSMDPSIGTEQYLDVIVEQVHQVEASFAHPLGIHTLRSQAALDAQHLAAATEPNVPWSRTYSTYYERIVTYAGGVEFSCRYINRDGRRLLCSVQFNMSRACRLVQLEIIAGNGQRSYYEDEVPIPNVAPIEFPEYA